MTPAYLNSPPSPFPFLELKEDQQLQFFIPPHQTSSSLSSSIFFNITQDQTVRHPGEEWKKNQHKADKYIFNAGSSDKQVIPSSSVHPMVESTEDGSELFVSKLEDEDHNKRDKESAKWMSSKMRLMRKMMNTGHGGTDKQERIMHKFHNQQHENSETNSYNNSSNIIRVCSDCNTTKTPLWRSGPQGPKSLCNACGIRQRKARRAMAAAANNGMVLGRDNSTRRTKMQKKEKKSRTSYNMVQYKKPFKIPGSPQPGEKISFEDFALSLSKNSPLRRTFPKDEEEAAVLLMALSYGLLYS